MLASAARRGVRMASTASEALYLGLDSSTQGLKATAITRDFKVAHAFAINYQRDLPHYNLVNGVHAKPGHVVTQPTLMVRRAALRRRDHRPASGQARLRRSPRG